MKETGDTARPSVGLLTAIAVLTLTGVLVLWETQLLRGPSPRTSGVNTAPPAIAATYQTVTTTVDAAPAGETASTLTWRWQYDTDGRLSGVVGPGGVTTHITHTQAEGEVDGPADEDDRRVFARDARGLLLSAKRSGGSVFFSYSPSGLPTEVRAEGAPSLGYVRDPQGRLAEMRIGTAAAIQYRYDYLGRLVAIVTPSGEITYTYHTAANTVVRRLPNGVQTIREYDDEGTLIALSHVDAQRRILAAYAYTHRPDGLIAQITERRQTSGEQVCRYQYDVMQRVAAVDCRGRSYHYRYDSLGNLVESSTDKGELLRITNTAAGAPSTDSRGPSRTDERGHIRQLPASGTAVDYDFNNVGELSAANRQEIQYTYNALGLLSSRTVQGRKTQYLPDPFADAWQPIWQRDADGTETLTVWDGAVPLFELQGKSARYRLEDHLGSVRIEVDRQGRIVASHDYTPYGAPEEAAAADLTPGFAGLIWDPLAKVYHAMTRAYDPVTARFLQPDPQVRVPDDSKDNHSLYAYSGGDPVNFVDRNGAQADTVHLDADARWWDSFGRSLDYDFLGPLRALIPESLRSPLAVHTDPDVRDSVVTGLIAEAWKLSKQNSAGAHELVKAWRERQAEPPPQYKFAATAQEFKAAENYLYARRSVETGIGPLPEGRVSALVMRVAIPYWNKFAHGFGERVGIRPSVFLAPPRILETLGNPARRSAAASDIRGFINGLLTGDAREWLPDSPDSRKWRDRGVDDALANMAARNAVSQGPRKTIWQKIDDFLTPGAWADEGLASDVSASPSPVGGVYLGGAGKALERFGQLRGVTVDGETGKLVLIGSDQQNIALPPLRLDDVVTIFRAVFDHGQSPSVTIDPDERDPTGPTMHVKHGPGTAGTYVGWILFHCDRVMKTYQLGQDNVTRAALTSRVTGYSKTIDGVYFGDPDSQSDKGAGWERFWIVPASITRFDSTATDLSLFELPLKVNTQKMRWERGKLVDDEKGASSFGANTFKAWFSEHYDEIANEVLLEPPPGTGFDKPVAIFHELRRIAVIAAVAERLRDSGQTMPAWMRDYEVAPFPVPLTTPALTVRQSKEDGSVTRTARIYGGVNLAPADDDVHEYSDGQKADAISVPGAHRSFVERAKQAIASLGVKLPELVRANDSPGTVRQVVMPEETLSVTVLPGARSRALGPNRQRVSDIVVPIGFGRNISLTRYYNSFFDPSGEYGRGWTLDLPHLSMNQVPVRRDGKRSEYRVVPHLRSPLGTVDILFDTNEKVEPYGVELPVSKEHPEIAGVARGRSEITGGETHQLLFRDGNVWHFDDNGRLVLTQADGTATRYVRDSAGRVIQIVGYVGADAMADIRLGYDERSRIAHAAARQAGHLQMQSPPAVSDLTFEYGDNGRLWRVRDAQAKRGGASTVQLEYGYSSHRLTTIGGSDRGGLSFGYDGRGQLLWKQEGDRKTAYSVATTPQGTTLTESTSDAAAQSAAQWVYDARMRPVEANLPDGHALRWRYGNGSEMLETLAREGRSILTRSTTQDGSTETTAFTGGPTYEVRREASGRPTTLSIGGLAAAQFSWNPDGTLGTLRAGNTEVHPRRSKDGLPTGVLISAPMTGGKTTQWLEEEWDRMGRPVKIADSSGLDYRMRYDESGRLRTFGRLTEEGKLGGTNLVYDRDGRVTRIDSSWGNEKRKYTDAGALSGLEVERKGAKSATAFDQEGRPVSHVAYDGGKTTWRYSADQSDPLLTAIDLPNGEKIDYGRSARDSRSVDITVGAAIVRTLADAAGRVVAVTWENRLRDTAPR